MSQSPHGGRAGYWYGATAVYIALYAAVVLAIATKTGFLVGLNDFWGLMFMAEHLEFGRADSFYNGFFPIGYALYLRSFLSLNPILAAFVLNLFCTVVLLGGIAFLAARTMVPAGALFSVIAVSFVPKVFHYVLTPGPDIVMTAFATLGGALILSSTLEACPSKRSAIPIFAGGLLCGLAALFRYHGLVLAFGIILGGALLSPRRLRDFVIALAGFCTLYGVQVLVNLLSGHAPLETAQSFNVYKLMHGIDWHHFRPEAIPRSILGVIAGAPGLFLHTWSRAVLELMPLVLPALLCMAAAKEKRVILLNTVLAGVAGLYILVSALGMSHRAALPLLPLAAYQTVYLAGFLYRNVRDTDGTAPLRRWTFTALLAVGIPLCLGAFAFSNRDFVNHRSTLHERYQRLERIAVEEEGIAASRRVFTTDANVYFATLEPYRLYTTGGWARYALHAYAEAYPALRLGNLADFLADCRQNGVTHLLLTPDATRVLEDLGKVYRGESGEGSVELIAQVDHYRFFRITG